MQNRGGKIEILAGASGWGAGAEAALAFLRASAAAPWQEEGNLLILGPEAGAYAERWLRSSYHAEAPLLFGKRLTTWDEFTRDLARASLVERGQAFHEFTDVGLREYLRELLEALEKHGALGKLAGLWGEPRLFEEILRTLAQLRESGLLSLPEIERAEAALPDAGDIFSLLKAFEGRWDLHERRHDRASRLRVAALADHSRLKKVFIWGLSAPSLMEVQLLQSIGSQAELTWVTDVDAARARELLQGAEAEAVDHPAERALLALVTGLATPPLIRELGGAGEPVEPILFKAHSPMAEARAAAACVRASLAGGNIRHWNIVLPARYASGEASRAFFETLGTPPLMGEFARDSAAEAFASRLLRVLRLSADNFPLDQGVDYAALLSLARENGDAFQAVAAKAARAGIRKGLGEWYTQAKAFNDELLLAFADELKLVRDCFPESGSAHDFHRALEKFFVISGLAELARRAEEAERERRAHVVLAAFLRNSALLAASFALPLRLEEWLDEFSRLVRASPAGESPWQSEAISFFRAGEWIPARAGAATLVLGLESGADPETPHPFLLSDADRLRLSAWNVRNRFSDSAAWLGWFEKLKAVGGPVYFSRPLFSASGSELAPSWVLSVLPATAASWPATDFLANPAPILPLPGKIVAEVKAKNFSATFLGRWRECGFRSLVEQVWRQEDGQVDPELDVDAMDRGSIQHKVLEIFFREGGREKLIAGDWRELFTSALDRALAGAKVQYFSGGEYLWERFRARIEAVLGDFLILEAEYFRAFPLLSEIRCEERFAGEWEGGLKYSGIIDRVDIDPEAGRFLVVDYKNSSTPETKAIRELTNFQLQLYLDEAERNLKLEPAGGYFLSLASGKRNQGLLRKRFNRTAKDNPADAKYFKLRGADALMEDEEFAQLRADSRAAIRETVAAIRAGNFPVRPADPADCKECPVRPACRIRALEPHAAPAAASWEMFTDFTFRAAENKEPPKGRKLNPAQERIASARGHLVFVEAAAGSGKTTVMAERVVREVERLVSEGLKPRDAAQRILAISFTEKAAHELSERVGIQLAQKFGPELAALAVQGISTIHGFARRVLMDFPAAAGVDPFASVVDENAAEILLEETLADAFVRPPEELRPALEELFRHAERARIASAVKELLEQRSLVEDKLAGFVASIQSAPARAAAGRLVEFAAFVAARFDEAKRQRAAIDFSDIERLCLKALRQEEVGEHYRRRFSLVLVDEFQDTNSVQREMLEHITAPQLANLFVVGDAKQSIYRFRAADVSVFQNLRRQAQAAGHCYSLDMNYRSQAVILDFVNRLSRRLFPEDGPEVPVFEAVFQAAQAHKAAGKPVELSMYGAGEGASTSEARIAEGEALVKVIRSLEAEGTPLGDIALLLRSPASGEAQIEALTRARIPFVLGSGKGFYRNQFVLDGISLLRALISPHNSLALIAVLRSPWFAAEDSEIQAWMNEAGAVLWQRLPEVLRTRLEEWRREFDGGGASAFLAARLREHPLWQWSGERLQAEKLISLVESLESQGLGARELVQSLTRQSGWQRESKAEHEPLMPEPSAAGAVRILSVHGAKGLEFPVVILAGLDGREPPKTSWLVLSADLGLAVSCKGAEESEESADEAKELRARISERERAEAKRLLYVALTRAEDRLILLLNEDHKMPAKTSSYTWGDWIRSTDFGPSAIRSPLSALAAAKKSKALQHPAPAAPPPAPRLIEAPPSLSVSEISAFRYCGEFHRRKFVQGWDDLVVERWEAPARRFRAKAEPDRDAAAKALLKAIGIQKKERGIALHRVLERLDSGHAGEATAWIAWLKEAYAAQGADTEHERFDELLRADVVILENFLASDLGQRLFSAENEAYPEIPFRWQLPGVELVGAVDRIVRESSGRWIVADYKTSSREASRDRYSTQVNAYRGALEAALRHKGENNPQVEAWIIDLYGNEAIPVHGSGDGAEKSVRAELAAIRANYTAETGMLSLEARGIRQREECRTCPYSLHCTVGQKLMLD